MYLMDHQHIHTTIYSLQKLSNELLEIEDIQGSRVCNDAAEIIEQQYGVLREIGESRRTLPPSHLILLLSGVAFWVIALLWILSYFGFDPPSGDGILRY